MTNDFNAGVEAAKKWIKDNYYNALPHEKGVLEIMGGAIECFVNSMPVEELEAKYEKVNISLVLNEYQAANVRWLLRMAMGIPSLCTGDWNLEVLYDLEQLVIDNDFSSQANMDALWVLEGWRNGEKTP